MSAARHDGRGASVTELVRTARDAATPIDQRRAAFDVLVERFGAMALATARRRCDDEESARDACQEAFLHAWRALDSLREPAAFGGWLERLVRTRCARMRRRQSGRSTVIDASLSASERLHAANAGAGGAEAACARREVLRAIALALGRLRYSDRQAILGFYFLGQPLRAIAQALGLSEGNAGKRLYAARLELRRSLPREMAAAFLPAAPSRAFEHGLRHGDFDELVGDYRFASRPEHAVSIRREGDRLVGYAGGQRSILACRRRDTLASIEFDGTARFHRDRRGHVTHFVYYEFGRRLGVARKVRVAA
jgi:RNA polymerase sigma-70 factor (ECF subfamily)